MHAKPAGRFAAEVMLEVCIAKSTGLSAHFSRHCRPVRGCRIVMALRRQSLSPTANLLRNSRLFSLPNPLPRPQVGDAFAGGTTKASETATLPYPTHQAIATTPKSLSRGDWGLKRPLPSRSRLVQTSSPVVKVKQLDTIEHITDFDSAAGHVRTRQKFEELSIPMLRGMAAMRDQIATGTSAAGAFEPWSDVTSYEVDHGLDEAGKLLEAIKESAKKNVDKKKASPSDYVWTPYLPPQDDEQARVSRHNARRWKHDGPWVPGMSADEFTRYITKELSSRKKEFNQYLRHYVKTEIYKAQANADKSKDLPDNEAELELHLQKQESEDYLAEKHKKWSTISEDQITAHLKKLRSEAAINPLQSTLVQRLIVPFLRIPSIKLKDLTYSQEANPGELTKYRFDDDVAPLSTHPSAGLGYLRTNAYLSNHPVLGPQSERAPVRARVIESRIASREKSAKLGVAGFVTVDDRQGISEKYTQHQLARDPAYEIDIHTPGGAKLHVLPRYASVTNDGRIHIKLKRSVGPELYVARGVLEDRPPTREATVTDESSAELLTKLSQMGQSGTELDEHSSQAQQMKQFVSNSGANSSAEDTEIAAQGLSSSSIPRAEAPISKVRT